MQLEGKTVSLVLGSGGARGFAHVGVIEELERQKCKIKAISGCSIGALVGGVYAAGRLRPFQKWIKSLTKMEVLKLVDFTFTRQGFVRGERVYEHIESLIGTWNIEELDIPFTAVAVDLHSNQEVWMRRGSLMEAIRASAAIPTVLTPVNIRGRQLVDGAVLNPVPIEPVLHEKNDLLIVVNVVARPPKNEWVVKNYKGHSNEWYRNKWVDMLPNSSSFRDRFNYLGIVNKSVELMQEKITDYSLIQYKPDIIINVPRDVCGMYEFYRAKEVIKAGKRACNEALDRYVMKTEDKVSFQQFSTFKSAVWQKMPLTLRQALQNNK